MKRTSLCLATLVGVWLQLGFVSSAAAVDGVHSVEQLLRKLSLTLQEKSYHGLFTYEYGGTLDTLEVVHRVDDGVEYERLQHLSGPDREVVRKGRSTSCVNTAARLLRGGALSVQSKPSNSGTSPAAQPALSQYYDLRLAGSERVANRSVTIVRLVPKDPYRYGLTFSVDRVTGFPMKTLIVSENQRVLERLQFVKLDFGVPGDPLPVASPENNHFEVPPSNAACEPDASPEGVAASAEQPELAWQASWLPPGFVLSEQSYSSSGEHQLTFTDGLASFSVFVTPAGRLGRIQPTVAQRGATVALMLPLKDRPEHVTVVGEIPPTTAEQVAMGLRAGEQP